MLLLIVLLRMILGCRLVVWVLLYDMFWMFSLVCWGCGVVALGGSVGIDER